MDNNPISKNDPLGDEADGGGDEPKKKKPNIVISFLKGYTRSFKNIFKGARSVLQPKNLVSAAKSAKEIALGTPEGLKKWAAVDKEITDIAYQPGRFILEAPNMTADQLANAFGYGLGLYTVGELGREIFAGGEIETAINQNVTGTAAKTGETVLEGAVKGNYSRFVSKIPANSKASSSFQLLGDGNYLFQATSPGRVPGSSALYQKWVNSQGETFKMIKTTFAPDGSIIHIKPKF